MTAFDLLIVGTLAFNALTLAGLAWAFHWPVMEPYRIPGHMPMKVTTRERVHNMAIIGTLSLGITLGIVYGLGPYLFSSDAGSWSSIALQSLGILAVYDFGYYALHRTLHHKKLMRFVHGVHHRARHPTALESLFQHPLELTSGLSLLALSTWVVGPVSPYAFAAAFFVYSTLNILIHSGLDIPLWFLEPINALTRKHQVHHSADFSKNYASLTPIPDLIFGTSGSLKTG